MILFPKKFPKDADGQVLKRLYKDGVNFKEQQNVDFFVAVPDEETGKKILAILSNEGFGCELIQDDESKEWTCSCNISMFLKYESIIEIQQILDELCKPYGGYSDGWGMIVEY